MESNAQISAARARRGTDPLRALRSERAALDALFARFAKTRSSTIKQTIVDEITRLLTVQMQLEEQVLYPALGITPAALAEVRLKHAGLERLLAEVKGAAQDDELDADVDLIAAEVLQRALALDAEIARARPARLDLHALGERMTCRKREILASMEHFGGWD